MTSSFPHESLVLHDGEAFHLGGDNTLKIWDVVTGTERATLTGHTSMVNGCAVSPDGTWIVSASDDTTVKIWDVATGTEQGELVLHGPVTALAIGRSTPILMCGDTGGGVHLARLVGIDYGPLVVTAVDLGEGLQIRCPHCNRVITWKEAYRDKEMPCPLTDPNCGGPLKVNPFVVGERA